ncbi:MAG: hypothetical protein WCC60_04890 [Ilumatobacteraceae bacterium]
MNRHCFLRSLPVVIVLALVSCSDSSSGSSAPIASPAKTIHAPVAPGDTSSVPTETGAAATTPAAPPAPAGEPGPICDSIPGLDTVSAIVGEQMTGVEDNSSPTITIGDTLNISQRCDVSGGGFGTAIFERVDATQGGGLVAEVQAQGLVVDRQYPGLPGAIAWANGLTIEHDGLYYTATAITADTVGVENAPAAYDASAALLAAWIGA